MENVQNVFEAILKYGHDEDFAPAESEEFEPTSAPAGSSMVSAGTERPRRGAQLSSVRTARV